MQTPSTAWIRASTSSGSAPRLWWHGSCLTLTTPLANTMFTSPCDVFSAQLLRRWDRNWRLHILSPAHISSIFELVCVLVFNVFLCPQGHASSRRPSEADVYGAFPLVDANALYSHSPHLNSKWLPQCYVFLLKTKSYRFRIVIHTIPDAAVQLRRTQLRLV